MLEEYQKKLEGYEENLKFAQSCKLKIINEVNGAHLVILEYARLCMDKFPDPLIAVIMGTAYGGEVEMVAKLWGKHGKVYGYDTFEDKHPKHLAEDSNSFEATCMDGWYKEPAWGTKKLAYDYQRKILDKQGLDNAILTKGEVKANSCEDLPYIHLAFLDMDLIASMKTGYEAVKDKVCQTGFLFMHDAVPSAHLPKINDWVFKELIPSSLDTWDLEGIWRPQFLVGLLKK